MNSLPAGEYASGLVVNHGRPRGLTNPKYSSLRTLGQADRQTGAGLGNGFTGHSGRVGMAQRPSSQRRGAAGAQDDGHGAGQRNDARAPTFLLMP